MPTEYPRSFELVKDICGAVCCAEWNRCKATDDRLGWMRANQSKLKLLLPAEALKRRLDKEALLEGQEREDDLLALASAGTIGETLFGGFFLFAACCLLLVLAACACACCLCLLFSFCCLLLAA